MPELMEEINRTIYESLYRQALTINQGEDFVVSPEEFDIIMERNQDTYLPVDPYTKHIPRQIMIWGRRLVVRTQHGLHYAKA